MCVEFYSAALESKKNQILDLHTQLIALKGQAAGWSDLDDLRQTDRERETVQETIKERERIKVQEENRRAAAEAEVRDAYTVYVQC